MKTTTLKHLHSLAGLLLLACSATSTTGVAQPYAKTYKGQSFINNFSGQYGYNRRQLQQLFSHVYRDDDILRKIAKPKEKTTPWYQYRQLFLDDSRIDNGVAFYQAHRQVLQEAYDKYGVSPFIITAILGVETRYGKFMGKDKVITALSTIGFDYPERERFFTNELRAFLQMVAEEDFDPFALKGSYAGAMGMAQFMPSSYLKFAVDYEGDGKRDLWHNPNDAIFSIANYLEKHGWERDGDIVSEATSDGYMGIALHLPFITIGELKHYGVSLAHGQSYSDDTLVGYMEFDGNGKTLPYITHGNFAVITTYNTSPLYAMAVTELAKTIENQSHW